MFKIFLKLLFSVDTGGLMTLSWFITGLLFLHVQPITSCIILGMSLMSMFFFYRRAKREYITYTPLKDLPNRLRRQADNVETDGWVSASRLMKEAASELEMYRR